MVIITAYRNLPTSYRTVSSPTPCNVPFNQSTKCFRQTGRWVDDSTSLYRVFQKTDTQFYFWDSFGNSAPILTILSLLQAEIYGT